jgi:predicted NUDIX family NTP pyrophosphohydrolase
MPKTSAGILLYRGSAGSLSVLLAHPGGPFWAARDAGAWTIPKGELDAGEEPLAAARREFAEELGREPMGDPWLLGEIRQKAGKRVIAYALEGDFEPAALHSNTFDMEWPPRSGRMRAFPEVDRVAWMFLPEAHEKILDSQRPLLDLLANATIKH